MSSSKIEMEEKDIEFVAKLPKIELHLHLDGSLSPGKFQHEDAIKYKSWFLGKVWLYVILLNNDFHDNEFIGGTGEAWN